MKTVVITGGTGLIGTAISKLLAVHGYRIIILTRHPKPVSQNVSYAAWNPDNKTIDRTAIEQADYIINLAGANVADKRWTKKRKEEIVSSRVNSGALLVKALQDIPNKVQAVISIAGIGWYGDDVKRKTGKPFFTEEDPPDDDFLATTCIQWEESVEPVKHLGRRLAIFRVGMVLSNDGGAFAEFKKPVKFGIASILGNGKQQVSWIHLDDLCRLFLYALENERVDGIYNLVAPQPVSNRELIIAMAKRMKGNFYIPVYVPSFVLKIMVGELRVEVLKSATVSNRKIGNTGFQFQFPSLDAALEHLIP